MKNAWYADAAPGPLGCGGPRFPWNRHKYQYLGVFIFFNEPFHLIGPDLGMKKMVTFVKIVSAILEIFSILVVNIVISAIFKMTSFARK